jgi:SpoIID/LytB domain protein
MKCLSLIAGVLLVATLAHSQTGSFNLHSEDFKVFESPAPDGKSVGNYSELKQRNLDYKTVRIRIFPLLAVPGTDAYKPTIDVSRIEFSSETQLTLAGTFNESSVVKTAMNVKFEFENEKVSVWLDNVLFYTGKDSKKWKLTSENEIAQVRFDEKADKPVSLMFRGSFHIVRDLHQVPNGSQICNLEPGQFDEKMFWSVINWVPVEEYLKAVVPSEVYTTWPEEALKAQAVAARTYSLRRMQMARENPKQKWDMDPTTCFQSYRGRTVEKDSTTKAVLETFGLGLLYQNEFIEALYSAHSGGFIASSLDVFEIDRPYLTAKEDVKGVLDPEVVGSVGANAGKWKGTVDLSKWTEITTKFGVTVSNDLHFLRESARNSSRRVTSVSLLKFAEKDFSQLLGQDTEEQLLIVRSLRRAMGMKTSCFYLSDLVAGSLQTFVGYGFGHGVGMSQWGSFVWAKNGAKYDEILSFYYAGSDLKKIY